MVAGTVECAAGNEMKRPWWLTVVECELENGETIPMCLYSVTTVRGWRHVTVCRALTLPIPIPARQDAPWKRAWSVGLHFPSFWYRHNELGNGEFKFWWHPWKVAWHSDRF